MTSYSASIPALNTPLEIHPIPIPNPTSNEILIRTHAIAINPIDAAFQTIPNIFPWLAYPLTPGLDVAGEVTAVGSSVSRFKPGDRVLGMAAGSCRPPPDYNLAETGFQQYTILKAGLAAHIPDAVPYVQAAVLPLAVSTVASGLFQGDLLGLELPRVHPHPDGDSRKQVLLVWGGSSSLGCNAIQLAVAAGYDVVTTCSPRNFELVKGLGARWVVDYNSSTAVEVLVAAFEGRDGVGALAIMPGSVDLCAQVVGRVSGRKFVTSAIPLQPGQEKIGDVEVKFVLGGTLEGNEVGPAIFEDYLPRALAEGKYVCAPEAKVVGKGLESCQKALDMMKEGVSATKLVVDLSD
ncbi:hypothetical protein FE257_000079 [Aspergillus nanangensis]|uniref:Enoyl reductase (ER) domain-containing protein n=1 Tax=Aspergillus nanangensis TaxID=2582783 RepID=A0AAD4CZ35_ASPNN|nr:hypothetical protein FE257_000079 [Aspergillus nanangensis]